ncbi:FecR domain-containing protein [Kordia algicida OT-1]|uniref:Putative transmembrane sensor/regulatory protein n=1 Tax=Kordia algicida OT-1 TaxID=391587 RepID=A9DNE1_9FLAO|nr:FecR domain-containing protein [Kordia algicida]EDP97168.1 putative transmembrane sensor/regulatory protein [Kordia algicida OT-1]
MNSEKNNEIDIAKWLSGELTPEEQHAFEQSEDYKAYAKIISATEKLSDPAYDEATALAKIKEKIATQPKVRKLNLRYVYAVAASLVLLFGFYFFMKTSNTSFETDFGQQLAVNLPDGSEVTLNAKSTVFYDKDNWNNNRTLHLDGEAYFKVTKGATFTVITKEGSVQVLGTTFNVNTNEDFFEVQCYSGKVNVINTAKAEHILTKGKAVRTYQNVVSNWTFDTTEKNWLSGQSSFMETPLSEVIEALENQYQLQIKNTESFTKERFTGRFTNNNRAVALQTVFEAMDIDYTLNDNVVTLSKR